jgi:hypothetical protein
MARRRSGQYHVQTGQFGQTSSELGSDQSYENAAEPIHNGNFAWNGQSIPNFPQFGQAAQGQRSGSPSTGSVLGRKQLPVPGSSGNLHAEYGNRNTGINNADARNVGFQGGYTGYGANGQPIQYGTFMRDGTQYGKGPHTIDPNKGIIRAVRYMDGGISAVQFQDGSVADIATAIAMAEAGMIEDVNTGKNREGQKTLRSYPDGNPGNNLSSLPQF